MAYEWANPAILGVTAAIAIVGGSRLFGKVESKADSLCETFQKFVETNDKTHAALFNEIKVEREKRSDEDKDIRAQFVSVQLCQMIRADKPNGKSKTAGV